MIGASSFIQGESMPKAQQFLDGALTAYPPPTLTLMKEAFAQSWRLISDRYTGVEAGAKAKLTLAGAIVAVTPKDAATADDIARMAVDYVNIVERDAKARCGMPEPSY